MSFPNFPEFKKLTIDDKDAYLNYYSVLNEPYCDCIIDNLLIWLDFYDDLQASDLNGNLIIRFTNVLDNNLVYFSIIGITDLSSTIDQLFGYIKEQTGQAALSFVPEQIAEQIRQLNRSDLAIEADIENRDYVYNVDDLAKMQGKAYANLRARVNNFTKDNSDISLKKFDLTNPHEIETIRTHIRSWSVRKGFGYNDPDKWELRAIDKHLELADQLDLHAYGVRVGESLASIIVFNRPPQREWMDVNHLKCDYDYREVYGFSTHQLALLAQSLGVKWINFEQDLGLEGLRRLKMFFNPERFLNRYTISLESGERNQ